MKTFKRTKPGALVVALAASLAVLPGKGLAQVEAGASGGDGPAPATAPSAAPDAPVPISEPRPENAPPTSPAQAADHSEAPAATAPSQGADSADASVSQTSPTSGSAPSAITAPSAGLTSEIATPAITAPSTGFTAEIATPAITAPSVGLSAEIATPGVAISPAGLATDTASSAIAAPQAVPVETGTPAGPDEQAASSDFDADDPSRGALASLAFAGGVGSVATTSVRAANSLTAAGLHIAPRYMSRVGDVDVSALGGFVNFPATEGNLLGAQISLQARLVPGLVAIADMGPQTSVGVRGPLWANESATVGWTANYRSDIYFAVEPGFGLAQAGFGLIPGFPGGSSQGLELSLNSEYEWDAFRFYGTPVLAAMSNRTSAGLVAGVDYDLGPLTIGYGATVQGNLLNPGSGIASIRPFEVKHSAGLRLFLTDWAYLQANYHLAPSDTYGFMSQTVLAGVGTRLLGSFSAPPVRTILASGPDQPSPQMETPPEPEAEPDPTPPQASEVSAPAQVIAQAPPPRDYDSLVGRISHSLMPEGKPDRPLTVALKKKGPKGWANAPQTAKTDAFGNYLFHRLPDGQYQVVYRNEKVMGQIVGAAVSRAVTIKPWRTATASIDVAWDESKIRGTIRNNTVEVEWPAKPGAQDTVYEVILKYSPEKPFIVGSPPSTDTRAKFEVSDEVKGRTLYYTVKFWKKGGEFWGSNYYGQSNYKVLEVVK